MKRLYSEPGFSLIEVSVAILIVSLSILLGMQAIVSAIALKSRAKQISETNNWIQENLELVTQQALDISKIPYTSSNLSNDVNSSALSISVNSSDGYRVGDSIIIGTDSVNNIITNISGNILTLNSELGTSQSQNASVIARCRSDSMAGGFAAYLNEQLDAVSSDTDNSSTPNVGTLSINGITYTMTRSSKVRNVPPYTVSEFNYLVTSPQGKVVADVSTEVVPKASFQCP